MAGGAAGAVAGGVAIAEGIPVAGAFAFAEDICGVFTRAAVLTAPLPL